LRSLLLERAPAFGGEEGGMTPDDVDAELAPLFLEAAQSLGMPRRLLVRVLHSATTDEEIDARAALVAEVIALAIENEVALSDEAREALGALEASDSEDDEH
jgi:hypothetical protein